jgi:uncharacterized DUF497 family protein
MRELVLSGLYVMTVHGQEEMEADGLTLHDVEHVILTGEIVERQRDQQTGEPKYLIEGGSMSDERATVVAKIGPTERLVIITVYLSAGEDES